MDDIKKAPFEEYIKNLSPSKKEIGQAWSAAIGLQDVDGLKNFNHLFFHRLSIFLYMKSMNTM